MSECVCLSMDVTYCVPVVIKPYINLLNIIENFGISFIESPFAIVFGFGFAIENMLTIYCRNVFMKCKRAPAANAQHTRCYTSCVYSTRLVFTPTQTILCMEIVFDGAFAAHNSILDNLSKCRLRKNAAPESIGIVVSEIRRCTSTFGSVFE